MSAFSVRDAVTKRYSVRTYDTKTVEKEIREKICDFAKMQKNPLGPKIKIQFIEKKMASNGEKLGTYGIIKGADLYLGVTVPNEKYSPEALGYEFEELVLYVTSLGLGTCWLGGTFNRSAFASKMKIEEGEIFPILSPLGYPAPKKSLTEQIMRMSTKADARMPWKDLFFKENFGNVLTEKDAGKYHFPLEMLRLAPSAVNKQPWRVVVSDGKVHFFEKKSVKAEIGSMDMQRIDVGIGICHFHLAVKELGLKGRFERQAPKMAVSEGLDYIVSWVED